MGLNAKTCHNCRGAVSTDDLEKRRAVTVLRRLYCSSCSDRIASTGHRGLDRGAVVLGHARSPRLMTAAALLALALLAVLYAAFARGWGLHP